MIDRAAVMRRAWKEWRYVRMKGWHLDQADPWTWSRCIRFAHAQERARAPSAFGALENALRESLALGEGPGAMDVAPRSKSRLGAP